MQVTTMRAAFVGDEMLVVQCAVEARRRQLEPVVVASSNPLVLDEAGSAGIDVVDTRGRTLLDAMAGIPFDVLFSIAYQRIIPSELLADAEIAINFHDGLLPRYGGLNVTTWSVLNGEREHGVTWHLMEDLADRGDIVHEVRFEIGDDDTAFSVNARCYEAGLASFPAVAEAVAAGTLERRPQSDIGRRMFRRVERPLVFLDPRVPAVEIVRAVRAVDVGPRAFGALGSVRWQLGDAWLLVAAATAEQRDDGRTIGEVTIDGERVTVQTVDGVVVLTDVRTHEGATIDVEHLRRLGLRPGLVVEAPAAEVVSALAELDEELARTESAWSARLRGGSTWSTTLLDDRAETVSDVTVPSRSDVTGATAMLAVATWIDGVGAGSGTLVGVTGPRARDLMSRLPLLIPPLVDVGRHTDGESIADFAAVLDDRTSHALGDGPFLADLVARDPSLRELVTRPSVVVHLDVADRPGLAVGSTSRASATLEILQMSDGSLEVRGPFGRGALARIAGQLASVLDGIGQGVGSIAELSLTSADDERLIADLNETDLVVDLTATIDEQFRRRCALAGDSPALSARGATLSYSELGLEVERVAALLHEAGVRTDDTVGIAVERSAEMVISVLAAMSLGAHYLPLDPSYPAERLELMVTDSGTSVVVAAGAVPFDHAAVRLVDPSRLPSDVDSVPAPVHGSDSLAYVIYTSGSTGRPKGVELEHRQVVNFFAAMDAVIDHDDQSVWLAATSLSFDISVLELLWTLTRGLHVVVQRESGYGEGAQADTTRAARTTAGSMSLFYFAADEAQAATGYRLLLESAKWADQHGFEAVWTPERHFHDFGAPYPNPSVVAAALAVTTEHIQIRAGSVVLPLHSPVRVAEEWAVVDNLSGGRVGLSFASGWQPNDFVLRPEAYATARDSLPGLVDTVQRLWRGERVDLPGHDGQPVSIATQPRPVQAELPTWITSAGSPASFARAGRLGANILTHLVGQTTEQLSDNIAGYRAAWDDAGHPGSGRVTLMLHTFLDADGDLARETARLPLKGYLGTAVGLLKDLASAFPTFHKAGKDADEAFRSLTDDEMSQLLDLVTDRYLTTSGIFGTVDDAIKMADSVLAVGVDEIACLIDFGIDDDLVLGGLELLGRVRDHVVAEPIAVRDEAPESFADLVERHGVTHFQCTPSLASMLVASRRDRDALGRIEHLMVGGEALPLGLATELRTLLSGRLTNMYGPTETTIWSLVHEIGEVPADVVPIGRPIANTQVHILDSHRREVPVGVFGELYIGGDGVARGYRGRPELNAERFVSWNGGSRLYATGDIARIGDDGVVEFGGRADHQVKIRGHRIELAEVESVLDQCPVVARSVVVARGDGGATLTAFVMIREEHVGSAQAEPAAIRAYATERLPTVMVPSAVSVLDDLPLTPNGKIDRKRLPDSVLPLEGVPEQAADVGSTEASVTRTWAEQLGSVPARDDNFFDIGGHSLLAVKMFRTFGESYPGLALTDLFRFPTVRTFAAHLDGLSGAGSAPARTAAATGTDRGARRRRARSRGAGG